MTELNQELLGKVAYFCFVILPFGLAFIASLSLVSEGYEIYKYWRNNND